MTERDDVASGEGRVTAERGRLPCLDGWRGLSIACVLIGHFLPVPGWALDSAGVELFFVLSGRLMAELLFIEAVPLDRFLWRRVARVVPALAVFVLVVGPLHPLAGRSLPDLVPPLTFTANYAYAVGGEPLFFGHLWSLCVEEHCYLALMGVAALHRWRGSSATTMVLALGLACLVDLAVSEIVFGQRDFAVLWRSDARAGSLILSAAIHLIVRRRPAPARMRALLPACPLVSLAAGLCLFHDGVPQLMSYTLGGLCLALAVNTLEAAPAGARRQIESPLLVSLGRWSYSLYLWQQPFFVLGWLWGPAWRGLLLLAAVGIALLSSRFIEQPARRWMNRRWDGFARSRDAAAHRPPVRPAASGGAA